MKYNPRQLANNLTQVDWHRFYEAVAVDEKWELMFAEITKEAEADAQCLLQTSRFKTTKPPYINTALLQRMRDRNFSYRKAKRTKIEDDWNIAKFLRNDINKTIRKAKSTYIIGEIEACGRITQNSGDRLRQSTRLGIIKIKGQLS